LIDAMFGTHDLLVFVAAGLLLNITPGPDMLYIMGRSTAQGFRAGAAASLGIGAGCLVHIAAAALGISAVLAASATAFTILKFIGAAYLVYVGLTLLLARAPASNAPAAALSAATTREIFAQGFFTNALNPKVALFFLAFVPQFIHPGVTDKALAFVILGVIFNFNGTLWNLGVAWFTARTSTRLRGGRLIGWLNRCIGAFFVYLGVRLAIDEAD
jgi:threonine/homoserine/homoserine lactone efflux protein